MEEYTIEFLDLAEENMEVLLLEDENGEEKEAEGLVAFKVLETGEEYIVFTDNEMVEDGEIEISASKIVRDEDGLNLMDMSEEEWAFVQYVIETMGEDEI